MKWGNSVVVALILLVASSVPVVADSGGHTYSSGAFVLVFLGFCALVVVAQLIPAIITLVGMLKGLVEKKPSVEADE